LHDLQVILMKSKTIVLYFGSFNPVHNGHLAIARHLLQSGTCDELWFIVSPQSPFKKDKDLAPEQHRLEMLKLAVHCEKRIKVSDVEFKMSRPSYTINTLEKLRSDFPFHVFGLIMGADNLKHLTQWKQWDKILKDHLVYVYPRKESKTIALKHENIIILHDAPLLKVSSSIIRKKIKKGVSPVEDLHTEVFRYILQNQLYR
jgi:nicotinate-nucleotide adenylyltransferase